MENNLKQLPERFSVYAKTIEEARYITEKQKELCRYGYNAQNNVYYRFSPKESDNSGYSSKSYLTKSYPLCQYNIQDEFTFEEFKSFFEKKEEFPTDDFCVTNNGNNVEVVEYLKSKEFKTSLDGSNTIAYYGVKYGKVENSYNPHYFKTSYTLKQLKELDMQSKMYSIKDLLKRKDSKCWVVKIDNEEQYKKLKEYFPNMLSYSKGYDGYLVDKTNSGNSHYNNYKYLEYNKIEFNQIKELDMKERKIIGYLAPHDLFDGRVKKGEIAIPYNKPFGSGVCYNFKIKGLENTFSDSLPKEIVEQWEAVYENDYQVKDWVYIKGEGSGNGVNGVKNAVVQLTEVSKITNGGNIDPDFGFLFQGRIYGIRKEFIIRKATEEEIKASQQKTINVNNTEIVIKRGSMFAVDKEFDLEYLQIVKELFNDKIPAKGWTVGVETVTIGCKKGFKKSDIDTIIDEYKKFNT